MREILLYTGQRYFALAIGYTAISLLVILQGEPQRLIIKLYCFLQLHSSSPNSLLHQVVKLILADVFFNVYRLDHGVVLGCSVVVLLYRATNRPILLHALV